MNEVMRHEAQKEPPKDPLGILSDSPEAQATRAELGSDPLDILPILRAERRKAAVVKMFQTVKNRIIDISPDFLISADKLINDFRHKTARSASLSQSGGEFYNYLAKHALYKPNKVYSDHALEESRLVRSRRFDLENLAKLKAQPRKKSGQLKILKEYIARQSRESQPSRIESKSGEDVNQNFVQKVAQEGGDNTVEESVTNILSSDQNFALARLFLHNTQTGLSLDFDELLPKGYSFRPASMFDVQTVWVGEGEDLKKEYKLTKKDLNDYGGTQNQAGGFAERPGLNEVEYGNLVQKGGVLSLLHEIAHAWQSVYHERYGRAVFDDFFEELTSELEMLDMWAERFVEAVDAKDNDDKKTAVKIIINHTKKLADMGVEVNLGNFLDEGRRELQPSEYQITTVGPKRFAGSQEYVDHLFRFVVKTDKLKPLIEDYVRQERDAWAHALRALRFFREQGLDLEPGLSNMEAGVLVNYCLGTYQKGIELQIKPTKHIRRFTKKNHDKPAWRKNAAKSETESMV